MVTVAEMKKRLPVDKRSRIKASTVEALHYALNCVKQVQANSEYYKLLMRNGQDGQKDATLCTLEELERVTSEHTLKNTDSFIVVFSLSSGHVLYASEQAPSILCCKRKFLESAKFVELLFHQDVNVFYSHTAQPHLPPWSNSHTAGVLFDCAQVKSFFCRIRGGKDREGEMRYNPFRVTPYQLKVQGAANGGEDEEPCCLALAERIISGYEAPRIPMDKRIFTTTHSPGCVFLEVDERAVPLLGYLPQDLIGTSLLTSIHPEDRPLMLSMHRKVLKYAGQPPFEHSPVRVRCQNGDYITLDTSWSSFINPWSRKVAFIIGRHKVRTSPVNEDVFAAQTKNEVPVSHEEIKDLQAKIYKLFLQPVHNNGSSGYGSLGSNGSHEHYISVASSSDSNGNLWEDSHQQPMTLLQICADVNRVKSWGQHAYRDSCQKVAHRGKLATEATALEDAPMGSEPADAAATPVRPAPSPAAEERRFLGLTKEVLSAHTQKEEQDYVDRFRHRILQSPYSAYLQGDNTSLNAIKSMFCPIAGGYLRPLSAGGWNRSLRGKPRHKRPKAQGSSGSPASHASPPRRVPDSSWPSSESTQPQMGVANSQTSPTQLPYLSEELHRSQQPPGATPVMSNFDNLQSAQNFNPYMAPVMAVILPNYPTITPGFPPMYLPANPTAIPQASVGISGFVPGGAPFSFTTSFQPQPCPNAQTSPRSFICSSRACSSAGEEEEAAGHPALFSSSRSSSPLQLNLLQEELPKQGEGQSSAGLNHSESSTNSSKYFASNDSSETSRKARKSQETPPEHQHSFDTPAKNPLWSMIQNTPERVMMTYQIRSRDQSLVLAEDKEKLRVLQPLQPWFSQEQKEELADVHPWMQRRTIPQEIDMQVPGKNSQMDFCGHMITGSTFFFWVF
uniref:Period circadian clock 3 n=1 Tax=Oryzias sinensis TaxID=183150 RepID=A0A8C7XGW9_9TELE